jgi:hypothetical protein
VFYPVGRSGTAFYLGFFFRKGEKLLREGKSIVSNAQTVNSRRAKSISGGAAPSQVIPLDKTLARKDAGPPEIDFALLKKFFALSEEKKTR